jgi:Pyridoxamine 5'-phosphate oxidase
MTILNPENPAHAAAANRLQAEPIIWLTSVAPSGQPQSTPVWFLWESGEFLIYGLASGGVPHPRPDLVAAGTCPSR